MLPVFVIIGRPNVGKSTLFNYLTKTRNALVADQPGVTRDRQYGQAQVGDRSCILVDTGGFSDPDHPEMTKLTDQQVQLAIEESDVLLLVVDAQDGLVAPDQQMAQLLKKQRKDKRIVVVVNKSDRLPGEGVAAEFYALGFGEPQAISATQGRGIRSMMETLLAEFPEAELPLPPELSEDEGEPDETRPVKVAFLGRPNVGKSTLLNRFLGEDRVVVADEPGTTRDSIFVPFSHRDQPYIFIDTAGLRRRARVTDAIEKFSVIKSMQAIRLSDVVLLLLDATAGVTEQDKRLLGLVCDAGKALVIAINKWDAVTPEVRDDIKSQIDRHFTFVEFARRYFISAKHGSGVGDLYRAIREAYRALTQPMPTARLTQLLEEAQRTHAPPLVKGRRVKLRYAHIGGRNPLSLVIHGKQTARLPGAYQRYLASFYRKKLELVGIPLRLQFRSDENPYTDK